MTNTQRIRVLLPAVLIVTLLASVSAESSETPMSIDYRWFCDLTMNPPVTLEWDPNSNRYTVQKEDLSHFSNGYSVFGGTGTNLGSNSSDDGTIDVPSGSGQNETEKDPWTRRLLNVVYNVFSSHEDNVDMVFAMPLTTHNLRLQTPYERSIPALTVPMNNNTSSRIGRSAQERQPTPVFINRDYQGGEPGGFMPTVQGRACDCWNSMIWGGAYYCPLPRTHCAIPNSHVAVPGCVDVHKQRRIVRSIWPVLVVWYASVLFCLSFTTTGRHAMSYCIASLYPAWNRRTAERLLRHDPNQANQMLLRHYRIMRARYERRLMRRLRRRATRDRRRARRRAAAATNNDDEADNRDNSSSGDSDLEEGMTFPNLWDLAIIPRPVDTLTDEPQPVSLTLKTRIYKQKNPHDDDKPSNLDVEKQEVERVARELHSCGNSIREHVKGTTRLAEGNDDDAQALATSVEGSFCDEDRPEKYGLQQSDPSESTLQEKKALVDNDGKKIRESDPLSAEVVCDTSDSKDTADPTDNQAQTPTSPPPLDHDFSEWDNDNTCTICYAQLEDGDRVGALPCGHEFHVYPCLKHWLTRRNVCPLCLTENIATPRFADGIVQTPGGSLGNAEERNNQSGTTMTPVISPRVEGDSSSSDQDRSSSRDSGDENSSGILDRNPNRVPAFLGTPSDLVPSVRRWPRTIELTSLFRRPRSSLQGND